MNKKVFVIKGESGDVELAIKKPTAELRMKAKLIYNREWKNAVDNGSMLQRNIEKEAEKLGLWNEDVRSQVEQKGNELRSLERQLKSGASAFTNKEDARQCALQMRKLRSELIDLNRSKDELYPYTAESFAEDARLKFLVSQCCVDNNTGKNYFKSYDDYINQSDGEVGQAALSAYFELMYSDIDSVQAGWAENEWLKKNGYCDDKFRLIDSQGRLIDEENRLIDENGRYVTPDGRFCDRDGNEVDADGNYIMQYVEFSE